MIATATIIVLALVATLSVTATIGLYRWVYCGQSAAFGAYAGSIAVMWLIAIAAACIRVLVA